jgi:hypothetical protein
LVRRAEPAVAALMARLVVQSRVVKRAPLKRIGRKCKDEAR